MNAIYITREKLTTTEAELLRTAAAAALKQDPWDATEETPDADPIVSAQGVTWAEAPSSWTPNAVRAGREDLRRVLIAALAERVASAYVLPGEARRIIGPLERLISDFGVPGPHACYSAIEAVRGRAGKDRADRLLAGLGMEAGS